MEICVRMVMVTLTFDSFLHSDRPFYIYNTHFGFILLMMIEIYTASFQYQDTYILVAVLFQVVF